VIFSKVQVQQRFPPRPSASVGAPALPEAVVMTGADTHVPPAPANGRHFNPVVTLNGWSLPWRMNNGVKEFHLVAEPVVREMAPGMKAHLWGYNGQSPGPTIEVVEGDRVRIFVTNKLPEHTSVHWHGLRAERHGRRNGPDAAGIAPGKTLSTSLWPTVRAVHVPPACRRNDADGDGHDGLGSPIPDTASRPSTATSSSCSTPTMSSRAATRPDQHHARLQSVDLQQPRLPRYRYYRCGRATRCASASAT
jgi:hypothetical protein